MKNIIMNSHKPYEKKEYNYDIYEILGIDKNEFTQMEYKKLEPFDTKSDKLVFVPFPADRYVPESTNKKQIVLHHTVSNPKSAMGDINYWTSDSKRIATAIVIQDDGKAYQCFSSRLWAYHLGAGNSNLDKHSIGIEIDNWGGLTKTDKGLFNVYGHKLDLKDSEIMYFENGFRGYNYFQKYTEAQIDTTGELLLLWNKVYGIPLDYNDDIWDLTNRAKNGESGVFTHCSYRSDKSDVFPQPELISMLKSLA